MKIFSLQKKYHIGWSIILGFIISWLTAYFTFSEEFSYTINNFTTNKKELVTILHFGFPYRSQIDASLGYESSTLLVNWGINILIWIVVIYIILFIIKKLSHKQTKAR